ncbi:MAG: sulfotransferase family protein [Sphingomonadaceae bacterium]
MLKSVLGRALFSAARIRQIHIIGCSRSGTTMLHAAMSAFADVELHPAETRAEQPTPAERLAIARRMGRGSGRPRWFITKRAYAWFQPQQLEALARRAVAERVGIIHLVRDPRDVLLSRHATSDRDRYVTPGHWRASIEAARWLEARVHPPCAWLTLRYEDIVLDPRAVERALATTFGLRLRPGAQIDRVKDSLASAGVALQGYMAVNMQGVRNADRRSIGKWRSSPDNPEADLLADPATAALYRDFLSAHGYDDARLAA